MDKEEEIKMHLAKSPKKTTKTFMKIFNSFCGRCRQMALSDPSRPMEDYCHRCQEKINKILGDKNEL